jgi:L-fucose mutarotase
MLNFGLTHPTLIGALAAAGHGSQVLVADGNYPHSTGVNPSATRIYLNLAPGLLDVDDVLKVLVGAIPIESATVMLPEDRSEPAAVSGYRRALDASLTWHELGRHEFYAAARTRDVAIVIATGDQRHYANLLLTIGVRPDASAITP